VVDAVMSGGEAGKGLEVGIAGARLLVPETTVLDGMDAQVASDFDAALSRLSAAGARIVRTGLKAFERIPATLKKGGLSASESYHWHKAMVAARKADYDPRVLARIMRGTEQSADDYLDLIAERRQAIAEFEATMAGFDAVLSPTVPVVAPRIADCEPDQEYNRVNMLVLRNTLMLNVLDGCSIALPMHAQGAAPTSLMISGPAMADQHILALAEAIEAVLAAARR
jgi:aspartyl-tRNA(Asn)/glutamyl-tRNA(Gln) amidotransferase subunit A